jgi:hypothetical protein
LRGVATTTEVRPFDDATYSRRKQDGTVVSEETRDGYVFFTVEATRQALLRAVGAGAGSAYITLTNRFQTPVPKDK